MRILKFIIISIFIILFDGKKIFRVLYGRKLYRYRQQANIYCLGCEINLVFVCSHEGWQEADGLRLRPCVLRATIACLWSFLEQNSLCIHGLCGIVTA